MHQPAAFAAAFYDGLFITLDENFLPTESLHSWANGRRHAISDALLWKGDTIAVKSGQR